MATGSSSLPGKFHGQRSLVGKSSWGHKELDTTERLSIHTHTHTHTQSVDAKTFGVAFRKGSPDPCISACSCFKVCRISPKPLSIKELILIFFLSSLSSAHPTPCSHPVLNIDLASLQLERILPLQEVGRIELTTEEFLACRGEPDLKTTDLFLFVKCQNFLQKQKTI
ncbi:unnamed protein product [Rangifer tarandus platyrhynchus]|uniref:Uncharacterized protein n=1 Tax=Rangifer tarandus platyrhynchus TaxID=3082113 RepID=A0AC59ZTS2_RANTA